jgi:hypothetical protein
VAESVSLRQYVEQRLESAERTVENARKALADQVQSRFQATEQAVQKTEQSVADRLKSITDALSAVTLRVETFVTRQELSSLLEKFDLRSSENLQRQLRDLDEKGRLRVEALDSKQAASTAVQQREFQVWREGLADTENARREGLSEQMRLINQATEKAAQAMERRLEGMNEFRQQLRDQSGQFIVRQEFQVQTQALIAQITDLRASRDKDEGRRTVTTTLIALGSSLTVSLIVGVVLFALSKH